MAKIALIPPTLINQIAAGEVIERPASVVKELVENSLDASATFIEVVLQKAGRELIRVTDNGSGMDETDARMCLERHATSKIRSFDDLTHVGTMGFRGEALPSIASISYLTLKTRSAGAENAFEIRIEGGKKMSEAPAGTFGEKPGTSITIEHLFYNVPARRKFLKSDTTELGHCVELLKYIALANPAVGFKLLDGKRTILDLPEKQSSAERLRAIFGAETMEKLQPVMASHGENGNTHLTGFISPLGVSFPTRGKIAFFINQRPVDSKIFHQALREAYGSSMTRGAYPAAFLFLTLPPEEIDVNVHPAKREVRFRAEREKLIFLIQSLGHALQSKSPTSFGSPSFSAPFSSVFTAAPSIDYSSNAQLPRLSPIEISPAFSAQPFAPQPLTTQTRFAVAETSAARHGWQFLNFFGANSSTDYALFSTPEGLAIISIPNAQECVAYEKIENYFSKDSAKSNSTRSQSLLIPALLQLEGPLEEILKANEKFISSQGFSVAPFGSGTWRLEAIPEWLSPENGFAGAPENLFIAELNALCEGTLARADERLKQRHFAQLASGYARTKISHPEAVRDLIDKLLACKNPLKTAQGHPTVWMVTPEELRKRFHA